MYRISNIRVVIAIILIPVFIIGIVQLFRLRFEAGDIYPPYSTLRSDPLGTRALFESLESLDGIGIRRNYTPPERFTTENPGSFFSLGMILYGYEGGWDQIYFPENRIEMVERIAGNGGRVIISFYTLSMAESKKEKARNQKKEHTIKKKKKKAAKNDGEKESEKSTLQEFLSSGNMTERWGFRVAVGGWKIYRGTCRRVVSDGALPETIPFHSPLYFGQLSDAWRPVYTVKKHPVIMERRFGKGSIVLCADSYLFSNEALAKSPLPELFSWFNGPNRRIVFDESHFGVTENPGIAGLAVKYHLDGFFWGLAILGILLIWKQNSRFALPRESAAPEEQTALDSKKNRLQGIVSLLRWNIPEKQILKVCIHEWTQDVEIMNRLETGKKERIEKLAMHPEKIPEPVSGYRMICRFLKGK